MKKSVVIFPHNKRAYKKVCAALEVSNRTCVIHPTGTGKMYVALQLIDANADKHILYLTSYSPILAALETEMEKCGVTAGNLSTRLYAGLDAAAVEHHYDYIILDEFHRAGAEVWGQWISKLLNNNPQAKILGLSATPIRYLDNNRDMSDELFDGNVASSMTLAEAVGTGILKMPKYVCAAYSLSDEIEAYADRISKIKTAGKKTEALALLEKARRSLEQSDGLHEIFAKHIPVKNGRYIVFCRNYEHMKAMQAECRIWLQSVNRKIKLYEVRADLPDAINARMLEDFSADNSEKLKLLFSIDMLNEGVHADSIDGCIMMRPTESMNVYLQQLGRAISVGSKEQTVVFDIVNNSAQLNAFGNFKNDVQRAAANAGCDIEIEDFEIHESLKDFYEIITQIDHYISRANWDDSFAKAKAFYEKNGHLCPFSPDDRELRMWLNGQRSRYRLGTISKEKKEMLDSLKMVWDVLGDRWAFMYAQAKDIFEKYGKVYIPQELLPAELVAWISTQRYNYKKGMLTKEREQALNDIGMVWNEKDEAWEQMFRCAQIFYQTHKHLKVERKYKTHDGKALGSWMKHQRERAKNGLMTEDQKARLESIGMIWDVNEEKWQRMYDCAQAYYLRCGHLNVTQKDGKELCDWIRVQRQNHKMGAMSAERKFRLDTIGMIWEAAYNDLLWEQMFNCAKEFAQEHKHLRIHRDYKTPDGLALGSWVHAQRRAYREQSLSAERIKKLEEIGILWGYVADASWEKMYALAKNYYEVNGNLKIHQHYKTTDGQPLGAWVSHQRYRYKANQIPAEQIHLLEEIGFVWNSYEDAWKKNFAVAQKFYEEHGHLNPPKTVMGATGKQTLRSWLHDQKHRKDTLSEEKQALLESIGIEWPLKKRSKV